MAIYKSELLKCYIDLSKILAISDAVIIDGWYVGFQVLFQLQDKPLIYKRPLTDVERASIDNMQPMIGLQLEIDKLVAEWKTYKACR